MKDFYRINDFKLLKSFSQTDDGRDHNPAEYAKNERIAKNAAARLLSRGQITIVNGSGFLAGLAYTSSGVFAGLWNCNTTALKRGTREAFKGVALTIDGEPVAIYQDYDENGNELKTIFEKI